MSDSVQPHRRQPTRLPHPWDSPGKSTGVGGHCLLRPSYVVSANYRVLICCTCHFQSSSLFILASSVCWSLQCLISSLTQGVKVVTYLGLLVQSCCGEREHYKQISLVCVGSAHSIWTTLGLPQLMAPLEKAMAPHSSTLAWKIPRMEEPGRLQSMGSLRVGHDWVTSLWLFTFMHWRRKWQPTQYSCLENPRDGGAWWAAVYGVSQSQTRLKRLSSSSSSSILLYGYTITYLFTPLLIDIWVASSLGLYKWSC